MATFKAIPLFGLMLVAYILVLSGLYYSNPGSQPLELDFVNVILPSGEVWPVYVKDAIILLGLLALFIEILKSTGSSNTQIVEHILSTFVFISYVIAFLMTPMAGNSTFFMLLVMSLIDVMAGFTISITAARRDFSVG